MSYKVTNGLKLTMSDSGQWKTASLLDTTVKLAGEEVKDRLYEPKQKKKLVRVLTVVAYVFFVSLAAIMLSLYYVLLWHVSHMTPPKQVTSAPPKQQAYYAQDCKSILADMQQQLIALQRAAREDIPTPTSFDDSYTTWQDEYPESSNDIVKPSIFIKKIFDRDDENY